MKGLIVAALVACLALAGCPGKDGGNTGKAPSGKYAEYSLKLRDATAFETELKRLQEHFAGDGSAGAVTSGSAQLNYKLGQRVREDGIAVVMRDNTTDEELVLWVWRDSTGKQAAPQLVNQQELGGGGMSLQYQLDGGVFLALSLRWVQDRYLEVKRNYEAGGLDAELPMGSDYTAWTLELPPLPYRLAAGASGPFGVLEEAQADGAWHSANYPGELMLPALAAYDQSRGVLLAISDEHPRRMDREYHCGWRLANGMDGNDGNRQLGIDYTVFNTTVDGFTEPLLISGLPQRDSVVLEAFNLQPTTMEDSFVAGTTQQVADRMSDFVAAFHARYSPRLVTEQHSMLDAPGISPETSGAELAALHEVLELKTGLWDTAGIITDTRTGASFPDGLATAGLPADAAAKCDEFGITQWQRVSPFSLPADSPELKSDRELALLDKPGNGPGRVPLRIRRPQTADSLLSAFDGVTGKALLLDLDTLVTGGQDPRSQPLAGSQQAAAAMLAMKLCEDNSAKEQPLKLAIEGLPSLGMPPCADIYLLPHAADGPLLRDRMLGMLTLRIFGVAAWPGHGIDNSAGLAVAVTENSAGLVVDYELARGSSDRLLQANLELFREAGKLDDYVMMHCEPRYGSYTLTGEAPASPDALLLGLPAKWSGRSLVRVCIFGTGVDALVDREMMMLNLQLGNGGSVLQPMPFGNYEIQNEQPEAIPAGDALLLMRNLATPETQGRS
ncbi:hypothetical protein KDL29_13410 [bacterium]|nr:hypothetical protein [bacterium]